MADVSVACSIAIQEYKRARRNLQRFWNLLYATSGAATITLIVGLIAVIRGDASGAIASGVGALLSGGGAATLIKLKDNAVDELVRAQSSVRADCVGVGDLGMRGGSESAQAAKTSRPNVAAAEVVRLLTDEE